MVLNARLCCLQLSAFVSRRVGGSRGVEVAHLGAASCRVPDPLGIRVGVRRHLVGSFARGQGARGFFHHMDLGWRR